MKKIFNLKFYCFLSLTFVFLPSYIFASTVYFDTSHSEFRVGDKIIVNVRLDSEGKNINTIDGSISLNYSDKSVSVSDISLSDSIFSLWPRKPSLSIKNNAISFVGGVPGGVISKDSVVFKLILSLQNEGKVTISPNDILVYLNDGKGTNDKVKSKSLVITVLPKKDGVLPVNDWSGSVIDDKTPPEPFVVSMGQEGSVFDGKKFISFNTIDKESDVEYYEVKEGDLAPVRSGNTYILQEQNKSVKIVVTAYDTFGNARKSNYNPSTKSISVYLISFIFIIIILISTFVIFKKKKKSNVA